MTPGPNQRDPIGQALVDEDTESLEDTIQDEDHVRIHYLADVSVFTNLGPLE